MIGCGWEEDKVCNNKKVGVWTNEDFFLLFNYPTGTTGCSSNEREWIPIECMFDLGFINACSSTTCGSLLIGFTVSFHMRSCVLTTHFLSIFLLYLFFKFSNIIFIYGVYKMRMNHLNTFVRRFLNILLSTVEF